MKRFFFLLFFLSLSGNALRGQDTTVALRSWQQTLTNSDTCSPTGKIYSVSTLGQNSHEFTLVFSAGATNATIFIQGVDTKGNSQQISATVQGPNTAVFGAQNPTMIATGYGYFPLIQAVVTCTPGGSYALTYAGSTATAATQWGDIGVNLFDQGVFQGGAGSSNAGSAIFATPFGSTLGTLVFKYGAAGGPSGSTLTITCTNKFLNASDSSSAGTYVFTLGSSNALQLINVPAQPCPYATVNYTSGGSLPGSLYFLDYILVPPGLPPPPFTATNVTGTTATAIKAGPGVLHSLTINTGAIGTIGIFDLASGSCTGTPATAQKATITATTTSLTSLLYDMSFSSGICVKSSAAMDFTVSYQ